MVILALLNDPADSRRRNECSQWPIIKSSLPLKFHLRNICRGCTQCVRRLEPFHPGGGTMAALVDQQHAPGSAQAVSSISAWDLGTAMR